MPKELNLYIYNKDLDLVAIVDSYSSLVWSDRYNECGDFELTLPYEYAKENYLEYLVKDNYCGINYSKHNMIIEKIEYQSEEDSAPTMIVSGRSLESILERRVILSKVDFGNENAEVNLQNAIENILNTNIINPYNSKRKIKNFLFNRSEHEDIVSVMFSNSYNGDDLLKIVSDICKLKKLGFRLCFDDNLKMVFELYTGTNRSYEQTDNDYVVFSQGFDNLKNSNYFTSSQEYKNVIVISVEDSVVLEETNAMPEPEDIERKEVFVNKDDLVENNTSELTADQLRVKGREKLTNDYKIKTGIEAEIIPGIMYEYGTDYDVGDIVQIKDTYGNEKSVRISEVVITLDESGFLIVPTFEDLEGE